MVIAKVDGGGDIYEEFDIGNNENNDNCFANSKWWLFLNKKINISNLDSLVVFFDDF